MRASAVPQAPSQARQAGRKGAASTCLCSRALLQPRAGGLHPQEERALVLEADRSPAQGPGPDRVGLTSKRHGESTVLPLPDRPQMSWPREPCDLADPLPPAPATSPQGGSSWGCRPSQKGNRAPRIRASHLEGQAPSSSGGPRTPEAKPSAVARWLPPPPKLQSSSCLWASALVYGPPLVVLRGYLFWRLVFRGLSLGRKVETLGGSEW